MEEIEASNLEKTILSSPLVAIIFYAKNDERCSQILDFIPELAAQDEFKKFKFFKVDAVSGIFAVRSVPTIIMFRNGNEIDRVVGVDTSAITQKLRKIVESDRSIEQRLVSLINQQPIMVFIKGTPEQPRCGFTRTLLSILKEMNVQFGYFDILSDEEVRQSLKSYSKWPTYPQLYVKGSLIGGLDIIQDLRENGELENALKC
ncbi:Glutaredoxin 3 [Dermatophagoides pteronyssinus]|uniref:Glutaredoxin 3 n=1 Tax=Dermatophagoides pteronyssinus TaxID=6956 RepID=A0ABQ8JUD4_DERPT|nr:Glutaredoxin 3 [Dermatophagoides pteronyssinus]